MGAVELALAPADLPDPAELEPPYQPLGHARHSASWLSEEEVAAHQRRRLYGAMIELAAERGYARVSTRELARIARVSKRDMYKHFPDKESYFASTCQMIVARAVRQVSAAYAGEDDWQMGLRAAFRALAIEVADQPNAARLALSEVLGAGQRSMEQLGRTRGLFETMVGASFAQAPGGDSLPPLVVKGIVLGTERIIRRRLLAGRERELPDLADELLTWALCHHPPTSVALPGMRGGPAFAAVRGAAAKAPEGEDGPARLPARQLRVHLLRVAAEMAAGGGWEQLKPARIAACSGVAVRQVREQLGSDPACCFLDALELLSMEALVCAGQAARRARERTAGVHLAMAALTRRVRDDRVLRRLAFTEIFRLGPRGIGRREALMAKFTAALSSSLPRDQRPTPLAIEASTGAIWGIVHYHVAAGHAHRLPEATGVLTYLALTPAIGAESAVRALSETIRS